MSTFVISEVRAKGRAAKGMKKTASIALTEAVKAQTTTRKYDIFLSHAFKDAELILGVKAKLEEYGYSVYIDWLEDPQLDRSAVTMHTAEKLRERMNCCRSLFYSTTKASTQSKWMPWECGYVDGKQERSAILPLTETAATGYKGQEYLGIYPYITENTIEGKNTWILWVHRSLNVYCTFDGWLKGQEPCEH